MVVVVVGQEGEGNRMFLSNMEKAQSQVYFEDVISDCSQRKFT